VQGLGTALRLLSRSSLVAFPDLAAFHASESTRERSRRWWGDRWSATLSPPHALDGASEMIVRRFRAAVIVGSDPARGIAFVDAAIESSASGRGSRCLAERDG
jgi:hypothetical protein